MIRLTIALLLLGLGPALGPGQPVAESPSNPTAQNIVLIHGLGSSAGVWDEVVPLLAGSLKVWLFELPGHGSTAPVTDSTILRLADLLGEFIATNQIVYPTLVGHGMGGLIAMRFTFDHPAEVYRLVVIDAAPRQLATAEEKVTITRQIMANYDQFVAGRFLNMSPVAEVTDRIVDQALRTDSASFISLLLSSFDFDLTEELPRQAVPILVVGSSLLFPDPDRTRETLDQLGFGRARTVSFKRVDQAGHFIMLERPVHLASVILAFAVIDHDHHDH